MIISNFINEIRNTIKIKFQKNTDFGINYKTKEKIKFKKNLKKKFKKKIDFNLL